ncbi:hypothetical protein Tco_1111502 [Tanacetum coccineum]|uniref:Uncharacterized protein n=1 Tax=Tanacetum coccineum TaxID=301880 RepID=A0ABQ5ILS7_9ASTR
MYVNGHVDIFDMVDINLFTVVALNMMVVKLGYTGESKTLFYNNLRPLTSLDEGLYALACEEDVHCLATLVRSFKLIEVYIEHDVTAVDSYTRLPPRFRATTIEEITDVSSSIEHRSKNMLLTWHDSSEPTKESVFDYVTPRSLPQHDSSTPCKDFVSKSVTPRCMPHCMLTPTTDEFVMTYTQLSSVHGVDTQDHVLLTIQSKFNDINLSFVSQQATPSQALVIVVGSGIESYGLSYDENFGVEDLDLNLNEPVDLNVSQIEIQAQLPVFEEPYVGRTQEPIMEEVRTQKPNVEEVRTQRLALKNQLWQRLALRHPLWKRLELRNFVEDYVSSGENGEDAEQVNGQEDESAPTDGQFFSDDEGIDLTAYETEYEVPDLVKMQNEIVEPDVDVYLFGISMDLPFDNIGVTNLVLDDVLEGEDVDVANADGFDSDPGNDEKRNYKKRRLAELRTEMEGVINASGQWKYSFYTGQEFTTPKEAKIASICNPIESIFEAVLE